MADVKTFALSSEAKPRQLPLITQDGLLNVAGARSRIKEAEAEITAIISCLAEDIGLAITKIKLSQGKQGEYEINISVEI